MKLVCFNDGGRAWPDTLGPDRKGPLHAMCPSKHMVLVQAARWHPADLQRHLLAHGLWETELVITAINQTWTEEKLSNLRSSLYRSKKKMHLRCGSRAG